MSASPCPLCGFPTHALEPEPDRIGPRALARADFPAWEAGHGLYLQCADVYRAFAAAPEAAGAPAVVARLGGSLAREGRR
jgi:hypothetical protein